MIANDILAVLPPLIVIAGGIIVLMIDLGIARDQKQTVAWLAMVPLAGALLSAVVMWGQSRAAFAGMVAIDAYALFLDGLFAVVGMAIILLTLRYNEARGIQRGEFYPLVLLTIGGMMLMGHSTSLLMVFLSLELLSIPLYILSGIARTRADSQEAALKYFLLGAFASGFLVFGIALMYGATGTVDLVGIARVIDAGAYTSLPLLLAGAGLVLVGLGFKVSAVPFHMWTPDVYEGAPTSVTAFMAAATKAAGFAAIGRVFLFGLDGLAATWQPAVAILAALTMVVGNLAAIAQTNLKRMLAYSSIAHAGYILMGVAAGGALGISSVLFYLASYALTVLMAFTVMTTMGTPGGEDQTIDAYAGLFRRRPALALAMALAMLSLTGIPPTAGFEGKYLLFQAAIQAGWIWLVIVGVLTSVISAYYYLRVVVVMFMREPVDAPAAMAPAGPARAVALGVTAVATLVIGILPALLLNPVTQSAAAIAR